MWLCIEFDCLNIIHILVTFLYPKANNPHSNVEQLMHFQLSNLNLLKQIYKKSFDNMTLAYLAQSRVTTHVEFCTFVITPFPPDSPVYSH